MWRQQLQQRHRKLCRFRLPLPPTPPAVHPLSEYISFESANRELESWNMLYTQQASDANVITNLWDGLLSFDCYGKVAPAIASSWEHNEDSTVWTFHLRDDVDWVDVNGEVKTHLTSKDFLVGFEWVMNSYKNEANNTTMPNDNVVGAADYYAAHQGAGRRCRRPDLRGYVELRRRRGSTG